MPTKYEHDTERWLRSQASLYRACHNRELAEKFVLCADDVKALRARVARLEEALRFILDECDWEESMQHACGDNRIGTAARRVLEESK